MATPGEAHGFEAWRRIHRELSLQSRAEALSFRASVMALQVKDGRLCDMVRTVEEEIYRYENLLGDAVVDVQDLVLAEADKYLLLMRGLPASVKLHCQLHVVGHSFRNLIEAVLAYDRNTRILCDSDIGARLAATRDQSQERKSPREGDRRDRGRRRSGSRDSQKGKGLCYNCGKTGRSQKGHMKKDCKVQVHSLEDEPEPGAEDHGDGGEPLLMTFRHHFPGEAVLSGSETLLRTESVCKLSCTEGWLVDSGATCHIVAKRCLQCFEVVAEYPNVRCDLRAANDESIETFGVVDLKVRFTVKEGDRVKPRLHVLTKCVVADIPFCVMSPVVLVTHAGSVFWPVVS